MNILKVKFKRNGLPYTLLKRNDTVVLYGIGGTYTDQIISYEVSKIYIRIDKYGIREALPSNERLGRDQSRSFNDLETAMKYFDELSTTLKLPHRGPKVVSEVEKNVGVILGVDHVCSTYP